MKLRYLQEDDAAFMLEWMRDEEVTYYLKKNFHDFTLEQCLQFIKTAQSQTHVNRHYAICGIDGEYMGTVSLKNINMEDRNAEYAITMRKKSMGTGLAYEATKEILSIAYRELDLHKVYLDVVCDNVRAVKFYEKVGFIKEGIWKQHLLIKHEFKDVMWLRLLKEEWLQNEKLNR